MVNKSKEPEKSEESSESSKIPKEGQMIKIKNKKGLKVKLFNTGAVAVWSTYYRNFKYWNS